MRHTLAVGRRGLRGPTMGGVTRLGRAIRICRRAPPRAGRGGPDVATRPARVRDLGRLHCGPGHRGRLPQRCGRRGETRARRSDAQGRDGKRKPIRRRRPGGKTDPAAGTPGKAAAGIRQVGRAKPAQQIGRGGSHPAGRTRRSRPTGGTRRKPPGRRKPFPCTGRADASRSAYGQSMPAACCGRGAGRPVRRDCGPAEGDTAR
jgi:hypothetical protein